MTASAADLAQQSVPDIVAKYPQTQPVFEKFGLNVSYKALEFESVSASAKVNQIDEAALMAALQDAIGQHA